MSRFQKIHTTTQPFICSHCNSTVTIPEFGTRNRNHCPHCLWSIHIDLTPGDRRCACRGLMEPVGVWVRERKEWSLIHRCVSCGVLRTNRIAGDDSETALLTLAARPLTSLPFPPEPVFEKIAASGGTR